MKNLWQIIWVSSWPDNDWQTRHQIKDFDFGTNNYRVWKSFSIQVCFHNLSPPFCNPSNHNHLTNVCWSHLPKKHILHPVLSSLVTRFGQHWHILAVPVHLPCHKQNHNKENSNRNKRHIPWRLNQRKEATNRKLEISTIPFQLPSCGWVPAAAPTP